VENPYLLWKAPEGGSEIGQQSLLSQSVPGRLFFDRIWMPGKATQWKTLAPSLPRIHNPGRFQPCSTWNISAEMSEAQRMFHVEHPLPTSASQILSN
jgi:hypothetical protein